MPDVPPVGREHGGIVSSFALKVSCYNAESIMVLNAKDEIYTWTSSGWVQSNGKGLIANLYCSLTLIGSHISVGAHLNQRVWLVNNQQEIWRHG